MPEINTEVISNLKKRVELVEKRLPQLERVTPAINVPSLNELRYTLVHLLRYLCDQDPQYNLDSSLRHARRAHYDCFDAEALFYFKEFGEFEAMFRDINLLEHIHEFPEWSAAYEDLRELMESVSKDNRDQYCEALDEKLIGVRPIHKKMKAARMELLKFMKTTQEKSKRLEEENERIREQEKRARDQLEIQKGQFETQRKQLYVAAALLALSLITTVITLLP